MWKVPLFDLNYDHQEQDAVVKVLQSRWLSSGSKTLEFEDAFARYLGGGVQCCAMTNCTAALHTALLLADIKPGDEVVLPGLTFVADLNVVVMMGATPVLADAESIQDWNISPADIKKKITHRTKALIAVHFAGFPCEMDELRELCREHEITLIEDVAHAVGGSYKGEKCGTLGDIGCFSFFSNKNLSVGEGGMFVCRDKELAEKAKLFRSHGMTSMTIDRHQGKSLSYDVRMPGFNYRIDEIRSALGLVQLRKLDNGNAKRAEIAAHYRSELKELKKVSIPWQNPQPYSISSFHIFPILLEPEVNRQEFMEFLKNRGVQTSIHYPFFGEFTGYSLGEQQGIPICQDISARCVTLPLFPTMTKGQTEKVIESVQEFFSEGKS